MTKNNEKSKPVIDEKTGLVVIKGLAYDLEEVEADIKRHCFINENIKKLDELCDGIPKDASYKDLRAMVDSGVVHMDYEGEDNKELDKLASFLEEYPFLFVSVRINKKIMWEDKTHYFLELIAIETLSSFYDTYKTDSWSDIIKFCLDNYPIETIDAERYEYGTHASFDDPRGLSCSIKIFTDRA